ncbi:hypothetical protein BH10ACI2_BH10ACI2_12450 [soil metagenome]
MFGIFRKTMTYEDYGYMCADTMLYTLIEQPSQSAPEPIFNYTDGSVWKQPLTSILPSIHSDSEEVARQLAILCLAFDRFCHVGLVTEDAGGRLLQGSMKRLDKRFSHFSSDRTTVEATTACMRAAAADIKNKSKSESFPTLVHLAIGRITGLTLSDPHWPVVSDIVYSLLEVILKTAEPRLVGTKKHAKFV